MMVQERGGHMLSIMYVPMYRRVDAVFGLVGLAAVNVNCSGRSDFLLGKVPHYALILNM